MRILIVIVLFLSILTNNVVVEILPYKHTYAQSDLPVESTESEKDLDDKSKIEYLLHDKNHSGISMIKSDSEVEKGLFDVLNPYIEIHSPPPEIA